MQNFFSPEFANRIDDIIIFSSFSDLSYEKIIKIYLSNLNNKLKPKKIKIFLDKTVIDFFIKKLNAINLGARPVERIFQKNIESSLSENILLKKIKERSKISFFVKDDVFKFKVLD